MSRLKGRIAVVTGAASGIGKGIAIAFAREGANVVIADKVAEGRAAEVLAGVRKHGGEALFVQTDVSDENSVRLMAEAALARFGRVDILVNNAGIFTESLIENMPTDDWDRVMNTNLRGSATRRSPMHRSCAGIDWRCRGAEAAGAARIATMFGNSRPTAQCA